MGEGKVKVIRADGNHCTMMLPSTKVRHSLYTENPRLTSVQMNEWVAQLLRCWNNR